MLAELAALLPIAVFLGGLALLIKSADTFIDAAEELGHKLRWPHFIVGTLIVGLGTSLPELASSLSAALHGQSEIVVSNIVGSDIANICLAFGLASMIAVVKTRYQPKWIDLVFLGIVTIVLFLVAHDGTLSRSDGGILLLLLVTFLLITFNSKHDSTPEKYIRKPMQQIIGMLIGSGITIVVAGDITIRGLAGTAELLGIPAEIAAMLLLAIGTSLPEILVSVMATLRGNTQLALGNVMGSNVINILLVGGLPALISPLHVANKTITIGLPFLLVATAIFISAGYLRTPWWRHIEAGALLLLFAGFALVLFS